MKIALIIIFNHKYEKNIDLLKEIYGNRFSNIYYILPFYTGNKKNSIGVYENSYYFQGYIAQALHGFYKEDYDYYCFISDDLLLNPIIDESNIVEILNLSGREAFISHIIELHKTVFWQWTKEAIEYNIQRKGTEAIVEFPKFEDAINMFENHGLKINTLKFKQVYRLKLNKIVNERFSKFIPLHTWIKNLILYLKQGGKFSLDYPVCGSYSDAFIIPAYAIKDFSHYCGLFAATELFVELAIPTALVFTCEKIITEDDTGWKGKTLWGNNEVEKYLKQFSSLDDLQNKFPEKCLYIHPVKLSRYLIDK